MVDLLKPLLQQDCLFTAGSNDVCEVNSKIGSPEGLHALKIEGKAKAAARKLAGDGAFRFSDTQLDHQSRQLSIAHAVPNQLGTKHVPRYLIPI